MSELEELIVEQQKDDTSIIYPEKGVLSLNERFAGGDYGVGYKPNVTHGTESTYVNYRCRCAKCKKAAADAERKRYHRRRAKGWRRGTH